jgi:hypothetical protein
MKNYPLFFMKSTPVQVLMLSIFFSGLLFGQEQNSLSLTQLSVTESLKDTVLSVPVADSLHLLTDTIPRQSDTLDVAGPQVAIKDTAIIQFQDSLSLRPESVPLPEDSVASVRDSIPRVVVIGLTDPLDTLSNRIFSYNVLHENSYSRILLPIDTTLDRFQINNPVMKHYYVGSYLGNVGLSYYPVGFEARSRPSDFPFLDHVSLYIHVPERMQYYQTQMPYTHIDYSSAGSKRDNETILNLVHTQNVNRKWNVGLRYDVYSSAGQYPNQNASSNGFSFFSAYRGSQYSAYGNVNWNNVRMKENGGLSNLESFLNTAIETDPENVSVRSFVGKTILLNRSLYLNHSYSFRKLDMFGKKKEESPDSVNVSRFTLVHTLKYEWNKREYSDTALYALRPLGIEPHYGTQNTHDSLYFRRLFNHFELMFKEQARSRLTAGFSAGLLNEADRYSNNIVPYTTATEREKPQSSNTDNWGIDLPAISGSNIHIHRRGEESYFNTAVTGRFFNHTGRFLNWDFNGRFYFTGYKMGDININGTVQIHYYTSKGQNTMLLGGSLENARPGYFLNNYASNWFVWTNDFNRTQEVRLRGEFMIPFRKLKIGAYVSQLSNYVYFDSNALPKQATGLIMTGTALVEKDIKWWNLGFRFRLYGQYSTDNNIIPLPAFAGYQSTYFEGWLVRDVLMMQLGWDFNYHTKYGAYAYMPSSGVFHLQKEDDKQKTGNYPFFDFFLNFQIKRARIFVKTDGLYTLFNKQLGKEYFMVYRYPLNEFRMKFGVSWAFYD